MTDTSPNPSPTADPFAKEDVLTPTQEAVRRYDALGWPRPDVALVSGSGLAVDLGEPVVEPVPLQSLIPFPIHGIAGHPLEVHLLEPEVGEHVGRRVLYFRGRLHSYQGYTASQTVLPVRLARLLGAETLVMTNATGGLRKDLGAGSLVLITDQINFTGLSPLKGEMPEDWGPRFPDMGEAYSRELRALAHEMADELGIELHEGVYAGVAGPSYETPAEVRMLGQMGGDVTGMSTVLEIIAARHMGMRCLVVSLVSNAGAGLADEVLDHEEVLEASQEAAQEVRRLLAALLADPRLTSR